MGRRLGEFTDSRDWRFVDRPVDTTVDVTVKRWDSRGPDAPVEKYTLREAAVVPKKQTLMSTWVVEDYLTVKRTGNPPVVYVPVVLEGMKVGGRRISKRRRISATRTKAKARFLPGAKLSSRSRCST